MENKTAGNSTLAIGGVSSPLDSFVVAICSVLRTNFCAEKPAHLQSAKRWWQFLVDQTKKLTIKRKSRNPNFENSALTIKEMKKIFLLVILSFPLTFIFGQNKDCAESGCGDKSQNITRCWGGTRNFGQGIQVRVKGPIENCYNAINNEPNRHSFMWHIEVSGLKSVQQDCKLYVTGGDNRKSDFMIASNKDGGILNNKMIVDFFTFSNAETIGIDVISLGNTNSQNTSTNNNPNSSNTTYSNNQITTANSNTNQPIQTTTNSSSHSNQVINTQPDNTTTEVLNMLETTNNQITNSLSNSIEKSKETTKNNEIEIKAVREEFQKNNLSDKEIDSLLSNPDTKNYATINIYNPYWKIGMHYTINGKQITYTKKKNCKIEYRVYLGNKLNIQVYGFSAFATTPINSIVTPIRKGKNYYFILKAEGANYISIEQLNAEPLDKKGNIIYECISNVFKSDIE